MTVPILNGVAPPNVTQATLPASFFCIAVNMTPNLNSTSLYPTASGNFAAPTLPSMTAVEIPCEKNHLELTGAKTDSTTSASYYNGRIWKEHSPGDISATFKWETNVRANEPFDPPQLIVGAMYIFFGYMVDPRKISFFNGGTNQTLGSLYNCYVFAALVDKNPMETDRKSGITSWKPETMVTGPIFYYDGAGTLVPT